MAFKKVTVRQIGETAIDYKMMYEFLCDMDSGEFEFTAEESAPCDLTEFYGRLCYQAFVPGVNKNVTKVREGNDLYLKNIIRSGHGSVMEHASLNFVFDNVSRVFTHELVRHRVGIAISQMSGRYCRLDAIDMYDSPLIASLGLDIAEEARRLVQHHVEKTQDTVKKLEGLFRLEEMKDFNQKKKFTSWIRRIAPEGMLTKIGWSANIRTLRYLIPLRTAEGAEEEIREVFDCVGQLCVDKHPNLFQDLTRSADGMWTSEFRT